jgi:CMP-N,N'-diacetyllegionaminic acid synthase
VTPISTPRTLALILARGGSKRLPGKNLRMLHGKPLVAWTIESALACRAIENTVVSTDAPEIAAIARQYGADVPFMRPVELAGDHSTSAEAALHALDVLHLEYGLAYDAVILLEPTSPLRANSDLDGVLELLKRRWDETDAVVTVGQVHLEQPSVMKKSDSEGYLSPWTSSSVGSPALFPYGVAYAIKVAALRAQQSFYPERVLGFPLQRWQNFEIDDEIDFICVNAIFGHFKDGI